MMTREEHLAWAKARALVYVDLGQLANALGSMIGDLQLHPEFDGNTVAIMGAAAAQHELPRGPEAVRRWIEGWN